MTIQDNDRETLWVTDAELIRRSGVPSRVARLTIKAYDKNPASGFPWSAAEFRRYWREQADKAGLPRKLKNMDSRAGAISEATDAGANLEDVRHAATHGDIQMTQRYSRGSAEKVAKVMELRAAHRKNSK